MVLFKHCAHKYCDHPVFPCQECGSTVIQCKAGQQNGKGWCCDTCRHTRPRKDTKP